MGREAADVRLRFRQHMPITEKFAYFDHAAVAPLPAISAAAIQKFADEASQLGDTVWPTWAASAERVREQFATLIHCQNEEIALVANTTTALGIVAEAFPWRTGDSVVVPSNEFPSNLAPWRNLKRRGVEVREVSVGSDGIISLPDILAQVDRTTRLVAISWVGFLSGFRMDVRALADAVHAKGALLMLDAIQGLGPFAMDVQTQQVDFLAADGHKWLLGPEGAGMLYIKQAHLELLDPILVGWRSLDERYAFDPAGQTLKHTAARYEGGSANLVGLLALERSVGLLLELGAADSPNPLTSLVLENVSEIEWRLLKLGFHVHLPPSQESRSGILGVSWNNANYVAARKYCLQNGVVLSIRGNRLRVSTHAYNNSDDIERLVDCLVFARDRVT